MFSYLHVDPDLRYWYNIWKVNTTNRLLNLKKTLCTLCLQGWGFYTKPDFAFNIFSGDLFFDVLIIELVYICLVMGQTHGDCTHSKLFIDVSRARLVITSTCELGRSKWIAWQRVFPWGTGVRKKAIMQ